MMENKLIITKHEAHVISALFSGQEMLQIHVNHQEQENLLGNIYLGKVKNIVKNINAAFVEISGRMICYLPLNEKECPVFSTHSSNKYLSIGDELLVQVVKEGVKTKAPVVSASFNLTGKYVVLMHGCTKLGTSSKINSIEERSRLKEIVSPFRTEQIGFIIRTNAELAPAELIEADLKRLLFLYNRLIEFGVHLSCFSLLYQTPPAYICEIRDNFSNDLAEIKTDDPEIFEQIKDYLADFQEEDLNKLTLYDDSALSLNNLYGISAKLERALQHKVWLNCGGYLVIEPTEALTVIDVNTGKAVTGNKMKQENFYRVNMEAAEEAARQLRLRNLSGIIIIDFIDMENAEYKDKLMRALDGFLKKDPVKTTLVDMTALHLVEITRKKIRKPLYEQMR